VSVITNRPQGLVSLTGLRDMGAVPRDLLQSVQCGIDITDLLLVDRESLIGTTTAVSAVGGTVAFTVPPGELWRVHAFGLRSSALAAGERIHIGLMTQSIAGGGAVPIGMATVANQNGEIAFIGIAEQFWLNPSGTLAVQVTQITTAGTISFTPTAIISRFRV